MIGSVTDNASDYLDFVGFDKELPVLMDALETRYGKGQTTDKLQQEFYQLTQERNESVQQFAGRLEFKYKRLICLFPDRYNLNILKERLFYGMTQHLRDSMRYLYKETETGYESPPHMANWPSISTDITEVIDECLANLDLKWYEEDHKASSLLLLGNYPDAIPSAQDWQQNVSMTSAKLDAMGQRWIASLANNDFKIFYRSGHLNVDADSLSRILWDMEQTYDTPLDTVLVKSAIIQSRVCIKIPIFSNALITANELVICSDLQLTKSQWRQEQRNDFSLKRLIELCESGKLMNYGTTKEDPADLKSMMRLRKDFFMENGLLYRKTSFKTTEKQVDQFVMPQQFCKRTVRVCHEDYGHLGMDNVQILLQERFYWPKMSEDIRTLIRTCERCMHFKTTPQREEMYPIMATYPLELIHLDFLSIGCKDDIMKSVLVVTDHFTRYAQCYVTSDQLAVT